MCVCVCMDIVAIATTAGSFVEIMQVVLKSASRPLIIMDSGGKV